MIECIKTICFRAYGGTIISHQPLSNENCQVGVFQFELEDKEAFRIFYACELYLNDEPIDLKLVKLSQKAEAIAHVLKEFGVKYPDRYDK